MSKKQVEDHYDILYQDEYGTRFTVFASTDLTTLGYIFAGMLQCSVRSRTHRASCSWNVTATMARIAARSAWTSCSVPTSASGKSSWTI